MHYMRIWYLLLLASAVSRVAAVTAVQVTAAAATTTAYTIIDEAS
jgi:hypothetical protein